MAADPEVPAPFKLERYFIKYEFTIKYMLSCSDAESMCMTELVAMADDDCKALWENLHLGYTESQGHPLLREEVAKLHANISPENVLVVTPQEGIYIAMKILASKCQKQSGGKKPHVVAIFPSYQSLYENLRTFGCELSYWTSRYGDKGWFFDIDELKSLLRPDTKLLVVNFPHNPTGYLPSDKEWEEIVQLCKDRNIFLFSDEMYFHTNNDGTEAYPSACSLYDNAVTLFGLSKSFGLPGLRIGWLSTRSSTLMEQMSSLKDYITICHSAPSEILGIIALRNKDALLLRVNTLLKSNLKLAREFFDRYQDLFEWMPSRGSTTGFLKLKSPALTLGTGGATGFADAVRNEAEILALPASMYDFKDEFIRIGFGRANFRDVLEALGKFLDSHFR